MSKTGAQSPLFGLGSLGGRTRILLLSAVTLEKCLTGPRWGQPCDSDTDTDFRSDAKSSRVKVFTLGEWGQHRGLAG